MKKMKQVVMRLFSTLVSWLGISRVNMGPDGIGKLLKNFCESVNKARNSVVQLRKAEKEASPPGQITQRFLPTQQKARGTSVQSESRPGSRALPLGLFSELSEKVSKVTPFKLEEAEAVAKEVAPSSPERTRQDNIGVRVNCSNETEAEVDMDKDTRGKGGEQDIEMGASVEELDLLLADFTIKSRERRRRRLR